jgi:hypothetical protein
MFKDGKGSYLVLPERYQEDYERSLKNPDILGLSRDIAATDARIAELYREMDEGNPAVLWKTLVKGRQDFEAATLAGDKVAMGRAMAVVMDTIKNGSPLGATWEEIRTMQDHRRKLVDTERRRIADAQASISADRAMALVAAIVSIFKRHTPDRALWTVIAREIGALTARPGDVPSLALPEGDEDGS